MGCGGSTASLGADGGSPDAGPGPGPGCPSTAPANGAACTGDVACEYGSDPDVACDTVATCKAGVWDVRAAPATPCATALGPGCPADYPALVGQATCSPDGTSCTYPEARCSCSTHCGPLGRQSDSWCCLDGPPNSDGTCPSPRPRLGSSCSTVDLVCDYGGCSGNVTLRCTDGTWQPTSIGCPG